MAQVDDVAAAILERTGRIDTWKFQKLMYYCQAWHLAWDGEALFPDRIEAWANGPVVRTLYNEHRGRYQLTAWPKGDPNRLTPSQIETIEAVLDYYGKRTGPWLSQLTHREDPWRNARRGLAPGERGDHEITKAAMAEYYGGLIDDDPE